MTKFSVQLTGPAIRDLEGLPAPVHAAVVDKISMLQEGSTPRGQNVKKLKGFRFPLFRLRAGGHRILYRVDQNVLTIMRIIDRKELENAIKRLKSRTF